MKVRRFIIACLLFLNVFIIGCNNNYKENELKNENIFYSFKDSEGNDIILKKKPQRVAVLFSSLADLWINAGGEVCVTVGETLERGIISGEKSTEIFLVDDGAGKNINNELLLSYKPDFIIGSADIAAHIEAAGIFDGADIPFALFRVDCFDDYCAIMKICTTITEDEAAYQQKVIEQKAKIEDTINKAQKEVLKGDKKTILFVRAASTAKATKAKTAKENFVCAMLNELGTTNIAEKAPILLDGLSFEDVLKENPQFVFFTFMGNEQAALEYAENLLSKAPWSDLTAIKTKQYEFLPKEMFHYKPNADWAEAYKCLAEKLFPEVEFN